MDVARWLLVLGALSLAYAHAPSHDNILRVQLWDAEGLTHEPQADEPVVQRKLKVNVNSLYDAMLKESEHGVGRFARHKVRHKRRRPRDALPWSFHAGREALNVAVYEDSVPWEVIEARGGANASARDPPPPMTLRQDDEVMSGPRPV